MTTVEQPPDARAELIADLRAFADLLERRPDMPVNDYPWIKYQYSSMAPTEAERVADVRAIAERLGVDVECDERGVTAKLEVGRTAEYLAFASTDLGRARRDAESTYRDAVEPDMAVAR